MQRSRPQGRDAITRSQYYTSSTNNPPVSYKPASAAPPSADHTMAFHNLRGFPGISLFWPYPETAIQVRYCLLKSQLHPAHQQRLISSVIGLWIRGFSRHSTSSGSRPFPDSLSRCFATPIPCFHVPWHIPQIFYNAVVCKRHSCFQSGMHAGTVHTV